MQQHHDQDIGHIGHMNVRIDCGLGDRLQLTLSEEGHAVRGASRRRHDELPQQCMLGLKCIYGAGSNGSGNCYAESCCDKTSACDSDASLLKSCPAGSCMSTAVGYYCGR